MKCINQTVFLCLVSAFTACSDKTAETLDGGMADMSMAPPDLTPPADLAPLPLSLRAQRGLSLSPVTIDTASLSRDEQEKVGTGAYLVTALNCGNCHGTAAGMYQAGGRSFTVGGSTVYARNLTPHATSGMKLTEAQFIESMRTGKDFVDSGLLLNMPSATYRWLTLYDLQAIYAYLKVIPAVANTVTADSKMAPGTPTPSPTAYADGTTSRNLPADSTDDPLGELRGQALQVLDDPPNFALFSDANKRVFGRGAYLVTLLGCTNCHTNPALVGGRINTAMFLSGGRVFATLAAMQPTLGTVRVMSANLTGLQRGLRMTQAQFVATLTTFKHADEAAMRPLGSPMPDYKNLVDDDMVALYTYLNAVPRRIGTADKATQEYARYCTVNTNCNQAAGETCNLTTNECVGKTCAVDSDCDACQTCTAGVLTCAAPIAASACLTGGL